MFGLLRTIRDKSESDIGDIEKKLQSEIDHISSQVQNDNVNTANISNNNNTPTVSITDSSAHHHSQLLPTATPPQPILSISATRLNNQHQSKNVGGRVAARILRDRNLTSDSDGENARHYIQQLALLRESPHSPPQTTVMGKKKQSPHTLAALRSPGVPGIYQKRYVPMFSDSEEERAFLSRDRLVESQRSYPFSILTHDQQVLRGELPIPYGSQKHSNDVHIDEKDTEKQNIVQNVKKSGKNATNNRLKLKVYKLRVRTDKALYNHFAKKVVKQREFKQQKKQEALLLNFVLKKQQMLQDIEDSYLPEQEQQKILENPEYNTTTILEEDEAAGDDAANPNIYNVVSRFEMDLPVDYDAMEVQETCHYCHYRPLHIYNLHTNLPMVYTSENGEAHHTLLSQTAGPRMMKELEKGGIFVENIEMILFALKFDLFIQPFNQTQSYSSQLDENCLYLSSVDEIIQYIKFCQQNGIVLPSTASTWPIIAGADIFPQKIVVRLSCDYFELSQKNLTPKQQSQIPLLSPAFGLRLKVKDEYAKNIVTSLSLYHTVYSTTTTAQKTVVDDKIITYPYNIDLYFNIGQCLCHKKDELTQIHQFATAKLEEQQKADEGDHETEEYDAIRSLVDSNGLSVDQFTYCVPHIVSLAGVIKHKKSKAGSETE